MSHTYTCGLFHCVFSTKQRRNLIHEEMQPRLWSFLRGIARKNGFKAIAIGGIANHVPFVVPAGNRTPGEGGATAQGRLVQMDE